MKKHCFAIALLSVACGALAENWVNVGTVIPVNKDVYADADSAKRIGDLAKIKIKAMSEGGINEISFDCVKNILFNTTGEQYSTENDFTVYGLTWPTSLTKKLQGLACRRWFEVWK